MRIATWTTVELGEDGLLRCCCPCPAWPLPEDEGREISGDLRGGEACCCCCCCASKLAEGPAAAESAAVGAAAAEAEATGAAAAEAEVAGAAAAASELDAGAAWNRSGRWVQLFIGF